MQSVFLQLGAYANWERTACELTRMPQCIINTLPFLPSFPSKHQSIFECSVESIRRRCRSEPSHLTNPISQRLVFLLGTASSSASSIKSLLPQGGGTRWDPPRVTAGVQWHYARRGWSVFAQTLSAVGQMNGSLRFGWGFSPHPKVAGMGGGSLQSL